MIFAIVKIKVNRAKNKKPIPHFFSFENEKKLGYKRFLRKSFQDTCSRWSHYRIAR